MRKIIILLFGIILFNSCFVPPAPKRDYYKLAGDEKGDFVEASGGYVYKKDKYILNLWVFSTPKWKFMYLNTNLPVDDSIKVLKNNFPPIYLKKMDKKSMDKLPYSLYYNDSVFVYEKSIKTVDKDWYRKYDTLKVEIDNKWYEFYPER
jgi:hypothetical protein